MWTFVFFFFFFFWSGEISNLFASCIFDSRPFYRLRSGIVLAFSQKLALLTVRLLLNACLLAYLTYLLAWLCESARSHLTTALHLQESTRCPCRRAFCRSVLSLQTWIGCSDTVCSPSFSLLFFFFYFGCFSPCTHSLERGSLVILFAFTAAFLLRSARLDAFVTPPHCRLDPLDPSRYHRHPHSPHPLSTPTTTCLRPLLLLHLVPFLFLTSSTRNKSIRLFLSRT